MRLLAFLLLITASTVRGQFKIFQLNKLDSIDFKEFIATKKIIVVGEMHGTNEVPLFVLQLTKQLNKENKKLTVGLEINSNYQKDVDEFLKDGDFEKLIKLDYFKTQDGRTSEAMGQLIKGIREMKNIKVICFDVPAGEKSAGFVRDSLMGINLSNSYKEGQMVILTGNLHANLKKDYWKPDFKSAIYHFDKIKGFGDRLISINTYFGEGTIWNCMGDGCKEREVSSNKEFKKYGLNYIGVYQESHASGYNGLVYLDKVTASKPLVNN